MASVYLKAGKWYLRVKGPTGWRDRVSTATNKTQAKHLAAELERQAERQRLGLELGRPADGGGTVEALLQWWLDTYGKGTPSYSRAVSTIRCHFFGSELGSTVVADVRAGTVEVFLQAKAATLGPQSLNHLRRYLLTAFSCARRAGRFLGPNPVTEVKRRKVPKRVPDYLRLDEVPRVLAKLSDRWRPLFATAVYTGLRKGELLGLRKRDVDLGARLLTVARSYDRETTKGGHADVVALNAELLPFLEAAIASSPSELVFPAEDGTMMRPDVALEGVLRRAMGRAGIVTGYTHVCRRQGCTHKEDKPDKAVRLCPVHSVKLWPIARVRQIRFHDLRHTCGSLLFMAGANPASVQRILRHKDPRTTTETYGHLSPGYLRSEVDRLQFNPAVQTSTAAPVAQIAANSAPFAAPVLQGFDGAQTKGPDPREKPNEIRAFHECAIVDSNHWPSASEAGSRSVHHVARGDTEAVSEGAGRVAEPRGVHHVGPFAPFPTKFAAPVLEGFGPPRLGVVEGGAGRLLTVREVACLLGLSAATVYKLVDRGELMHVRVSNAIRFERGAIEAFIGSRRT